MKWYVVHLLVELDKFLTRYRALPRRVHEHVAEIVTLRRPEKSMYQRDLGLFVGYVFVQAQPERIGAIAEGLYDARIAEVMAIASDRRRRYKPLSSEEEEWLYTMLRSPIGVRLMPGATVRITRGPYEGLSGAVEYVVGQTVAVRVPLRKSTSLAMCAHDEIEVAE